MEMAAYYGMALLDKRVCWSIDGWRRDAAPVLPNEAGGVSAGTLRSQLLMTSPELEHPSPAQHYFIKPSEGGGMQMLVPPSDRSRHVCGRWLSLAQLPAASPRRSFIPDVSSHPQEAKKTIKMPSGETLLDCVEDADIKALLQ